MVICDLLVIVVEGGAIADLGMYSDCGLRAETDVVKVIKGRRFLRSIS